MIKEKIARSIENALGELKSKGLIEVPEGLRISVAVPPNKIYGDFSSNIALVLGQETAKAPLEVAKLIVEHLEKPEGLIERIEVAGGGFINFYLSKKWLYEVLNEVTEKKGEYGRSELGKGKKVQVEFVSANPTGPLHLGHGRAAALGDALANILEYAGYEVTREYWINDAQTSMQIENLAKSVDARYRQLLGEEVSLPPDGYHGTYLVEIARELFDVAGDKYLQMDENDRLAYFKRITMDKILEGQKRVLDNFRVKFDVWSSEQSLYDSGEIYQVIDFLKEKGYTYEREGALWFKSTLFGDDKDRVLVRSNGVPDYFASDIAYHKNKYERGFDKIVDIWGPDHHGHVGKIKAAVQALGYPLDSLVIFIYQWVRLLRSGEPVAMSKREGEFVTLEEVINEVGSDAARFSFLMLSPDSPLDFDLELAKAQSLENPVYYVQYAHARICSILAHARALGVKMPEAKETDLSLLKEEQEIDLMRKLADLPEELKEAALALEPHRIARYATQLASIFHLFYTHCRVLGEDSNLTAARLVLVQATRYVLQTVLNLLGITAPERM